MTDPSGVAVQYQLPLALPDWELPEVPVPESPLHDELAERLRSVLVAWLARTGRLGAVYRNLAIRWDRRNARVGVDPDVCLLDAVPPGFLDGLHDSLRLWVPGHYAPPLSIEIVSRNHPYKDYRHVEEKYARAGVQELWVYDPQKFGPRAPHGPVLLQVWERVSSDALICRHFGDGAARSKFLDAWLIPQPTAHLLVSDDREGKRPWLTLAEQERAKSEQERARADQEQARADQEQARADQERARADELAAELAKLKKGLDR